MKILLYFDKIWSGNSLLPSISLLPLCRQSKDLKMLSGLRLASSLFCFGELFGLFLILMGAIWSIPYYFIAGIVIKIFSNLTAGFTHNKAGAFLNLWWINHLYLFSSYQRELSSLLNQKGLTDAEIKGLPSLPSELYQAELSSYPYLFILNFITPMVCALVLLLHQDVYSSLTIACIGILSLPLGRYFYHKFQFRQQREQRLAQSLNQLDYLKASYQKHLNLTLQVNTISQLPLVLFTFVFALGIPSTVFASYLAFTMGLSGLTGLLAFQKSRVSSCHAVEKAKKLISALDSADFLITHNRWSEHITKNGTPLIEAQFQSGVILKEFAPTCFGTKTMMRPLTCNIKGGELCLLQAPSGYGKSLLLLALLHMIDHTGDAAFVDQGCAIDLHAIPRDELQQNIVTIRESDLQSTARLVDLFNDVLKKRLSVLSSQMERNFGKQLSDLAFKGNDNLIETEIMAIKNHQKSPFPSPMLSYLSQMLFERERLLLDILREGFGENLPLSYVKRVFCTLSAGEQRRLLNILTIETAKSSKKTRLVIFDEPLAHLDEENVKKQIDRLSRFQKDTAFAVLVITHHHIQEIKQVIKDIHHLSISSMSNT